MRFRVLTLILSLEAYVLLPFKGFFDKDDILICDILTYSQ